MVDSIKAFNAASKKGRHELLTPYARGALGKINLNLLKPSRPLSCLQRSERHMGVISITFRANPSLWDRVMSEKLNVSEG